MARPATKKKSSAKAKPLQKAAAKTKKPVKAAKKTAKPVAKKTAKIAKTVKTVKAVAPKPKKLLGILRLFQSSDAKPEAKDAPAPAAAKPATNPAKISTAKIAIGSPAPAFTMPATHLGQVTSVSLKGKPYVLYFYPKDDTSGCTAEACEFRNTLPNFGKMNATIIGVSKDSMESHQKFSRKYNLNFPLASDENNTVCESFGTWVQKSMYGRSYMGIERSTFVVDAKGIIRAMWRKVSVSGHVEEVRKAVESL
jgi:peroxiredoxin Q/BCP